MLFRRYQLSRLGHLDPLVRPGRSSRVPARRCGDFHLLGARGARGGPGGEGRAGLWRAGGVGPGPPRRRSRGLAADPASP